MAWLQPVSSPGYACFKYVISEQLTTRRETDEVKIFYPSQLPKELDLGRHQPEKTKEGIEKPRAV